MVGLIKDNNKVPFISLADFIDNDKLNAAKQELSAYKEKQDNEGAEVFIGYNGSDWAEDEFQQKQKEAPLDLYSAMMKNSNNRMVKINK
jgi:hypothetical protein